VPLTVPAVAVMTTVPEAMPTAAPLFVLSLLIVATAAFDVLQVTEDRVCVVPPVNVPVAMKDCVAPTEIEGLAGVTVIDSSPGGVSEEGSYSSAVASVVFELSPGSTPSPPAARTDPSINRVAVLPSRASFILAVAVNVCATGS